MNVYQMIMKMMQENHTRKPISISDISINPTLIADNKNFIHNKRISLGHSVQNVNQSLHDVLNKRTAVKSFASVPIKLEDLSTILATIEASDKYNWSSFRTLDIHLNFYVLAREIENLETPEIYYYIPNDHVLQTVNTEHASLKHEMDSMILQKEFIKAPVVILCTGMVGASIEAFNSHGYQQMLVRGGNAMNTAWMTSISLGYRGSIFTGFYHDALQKNFWN